MWKKATLMIRWLRSRHGVKRIGVKCIVGNGVFHSLWVQRVQRVQQSQNHQMVPVGSGNRIRKQQLNNNNNNKQPIEVTLNVIILERLL